MECDLVLSDLKMFGGKGKMLSIDCGFLTIKHQHFNTSKKIIGDPFVT
jgi:hypothetical protein